MRTTIPRTRGAAWSAGLTSTLLTAACAAPAQHGARPAPVGPIATDRPGFLFSSTLVPDGRLQVEAGSPLLAFDEPPGDSLSLVTLPLQLRYGLLPGLELRAGGPAYNWLDTDSAPSESGAGDAEVGVKVPLGLPLGQDSAALLFGLRLPTGADAFQVDDPAPNVNAVSSWAIDERTSLTGLAGLAYTPVDGGEDPLTAALAGLASRALGAGFTGCVELAWFPAWRGADTAYAGLLLTKLLGDDVQLDASVDRGLTDDSSDWLVGIGFAVRM
ncbi:MAG TPA: transporter [Planctomycetota bacterium]|nr:transporter [Planctomycetota bacterium]